jgi:hypothetical protein
MATTRLTPAIDFIGTTDEQPLVVCTNAKEAIASTGRATWDWVRRARNTLHVGPGIGAIVASCVNAAGKQHD